MARRVTSDERQGDKETRKWIFQSLVPSPQPPGLKDTTMRAYLDIETTFSGSKVEQLLGIGRATAGISGWDAPRLWHRYEANDDRVALQILLDYNREDVVNLAVLERHLGLSEETQPCEAVRHVFA